MLDELIHPPKRSKSSNCSSSRLPETAESYSKKGVFTDLATAIPATPATRKMPSRCDLERICSRAVLDFPEVRAERLLAFLSEAQEPEWCSERAARHLARRMSEGLINES